MQILQHIASGKTQRAIAKAIGKREQSVRGRLLVLEKHGYSGREGKRPYIRLSLREKGIGVLEGANARLEPPRPRVVIAVTKDQLYKAYLALSMHKMKRSFAIQDYEIRIWEKRNIELKQRYLWLKKKYLSQGGIWLLSDPV